MTDNEAAHFYSQCGIAQLIHMKRNIESILPIVSGQFKTMAKNDISRIDKAIRLKEQK